MYSVDALYGLSGGDAEAFGLNSKGDVAGVAWDSAYDMAGVVWRAAAISFSLPSSHGSGLYDINDAGLAVGATGLDNTPTQHGVIEKAGTLLDLTSAVGEGALVVGINDAGLACGFSLSRNRGFIYNSAKSEVVAWIEPPPGESGAGARSINAAGDVVGITGTNGYFRSSDGSTKDLGPAAFVECVNDAGIACGSIGKPFPAYYAPVIWDTTQAHPTAVELPIPAGFIGAHANAINNQGDAVGTCWIDATYDGAQTAYIFDKASGVSTDLNTLISDGSGAGWHFEYASAINDAGQIVGRGALAGQSIGFLLTPVTKPPFPPEIPGSVVGPLPTIFLTFPEVVLTLLGGVPVDGIGWTVFKGGGGGTIGPWDPQSIRNWMGMSAEKRDALIALALDEMAIFISDRGARETVRRTLVESARDSLARLANSTGDGRVLSQARGSRRRPAMRFGKSASALVPHGYPIA